MTTEVRTFGRTAGDNGGSGALFAEGLLANLTTDNLRTLQAAMRKYANQAEWFAVGDLSGPATFTFLSTTRFRVQGASLTSNYHVGRRVRAIGTSTGTITGTITASAVNGGSTDVTVAWDGSGALSNETLLIELGVNSAIGSSVPASIDHALSVIGALTVAGFVDITGSMALSGNATLVGDLTSRSVTTTNGPFTLFEFAKGESGDNSIAVPSTAKRGIMTIYGAGGGGSSGSETFSGNVTTGENGTALELTTVPGGRLAISVPGGTGGGTGDGNRAGIDADQTDGISVSGISVIDSVAAVGIGSVGGSGANFGTAGRAGNYVKVVFNASNITTINTTGGQGGSGANRSDANSGGNGGRAQTLIEFYK